MDALSTILTFNRALSDRTRTRIWMLVWEKEVCVCHIVNVLGLANSTISEHLSALKEAGLISFRKEGKWIYYRAVSTGGEMDRVVKIFHSFLEDDHDIQKDKKKLQDIQEASLC